MPRHDFGTLDGRVQTLEWDSPSLRGNGLGDPSRRAVAVHLPPGYDDGDADFPLFVDLAPFTGSGFKRLAWQAFGESAPRRVERLIAERAIGPVVTAYPDAFTSLGGNQYVDSPTFGNWERWLLDEMVPRVEEAFRVRRGGAHRAIYGKSSGGYGALVQGMRHGEAWGALASHSGDVGFDWVYRVDLPAAADAVRAAGGVAEFLAGVRDAPAVGGGDFHVLMTIAMAASYDPDPERPSVPRLPVDPYTCELDPERWAAWLRHDPLHLVEDAACRASLARLRTVYFDCGSKDEYRLHFGSRALARRLAAHGVPHVYEEHDGGHGGLDARLDVSLPRLYRAVAGEM